MPRTPISPQDDWLAWRLDIDRRLEAAHRAPQLTPELPYPAAPYGGTAAPSSLWQVTANHPTFDGSQTSQPWLSRMARITHAGLLVRVPWSTGAGTTGEIRIAGGAGFGATAPTDPIALPAASSGEAEFRWLHGVTLWASDDAAIFVEARRTAGASNVLVGYPLIFQIDPRGCTPTGI